MRLTIIGSGTAVPQRARSAPCCLIRHGNENVVVDLGTGSTRGILMHGGVTVREVNLVLITHFHPDHCSDLTPFLFALRSPEMARSDVLKIIGPEGLTDHYRALKGVWGHRVEPLNYELEIQEWAGEGLEWGAFSISAAPTRHSVPNLAWLVRAPSGNGVLITGDGEPTDELVGMGCSSGHVLVAECALGSGESAAGHMNSLQAGDLACRCRSEKLVLTHFNPGVKTRQAEMEAKKQFGGEVIVAEDGMVIEVD